MTAKESTPVPRRRDRERTRSALLDSAATVFARKGFAAATLDEISEAAGFTRGAFHHHFSSKEELFLAVLARRDEELLAAYEQPLISSLINDPAANAARWHEIHRDDTDDVALRLELRSLALRETEFARRLTSIERAAITATTDRLVESVAASGLTWKYPPAQVAALFHLMSGALTARATLGETDTVELMQTFLALAWEGSIGTTRPPPEPAKQTKDTKQTQHATGKAPRRASRSHQA